MKLSTRLHSRTGLVVSMTVIATMLSACGGGGGGAVATPASNALTLTATPALGAFVDGATVIVFDHLGKECNRGKTVGGAAAINIIPTTCVAPLIVQAGIAGDLYFNEATRANQAVTGVGVRAVLPDTTVASFGVSALTEIAAAGLLDAAGAVNASAANVSARNTAIANLLTNGNVTNPLAIPKAAGKTAAGVTTQATNTYGAMLAMLASLVPGKTPEAIAHDLALDLADGTWDGMASGVAVNTPTPATFGAAMVAAQGVAQVSINLVTAATLPIPNTYVPTSNIAAAILNGGKPAAPAAPAAAPVTPINQAKNLFTSLRTSLIQLTNPSQTGFFDTEMLAAKNDLRNSVTPKLNTIMNKLAVLNRATLIMDDLKLNGFAALPVCGGQFNFGTCKTPDLANVANTIVNSYGFDRKWLPINCSVSLPSTFVPGALPGGTTVSCNSPVFQPTFVVNGYTLHTFNATVTPTTANNYSYTSSTTAQTYTFLGAPGVPTIGTSYIGTATVVKTANGLSNTSLAVTGQLAADGVSHAYDQVAINQLRTYTATIPAGAPAGFALAKYDATGSIASKLANGTTTGTIAVLTGSSFSVLEDINGLGSATARNLGKTMTAVVQASTTNTMIDGTITIGSYACDLSGLSCGPTSLTFLGSITNLANAAVGKFFTGTLNDTRDFSSYDVTKPVGNYTTLVATGKQNRIRDTGSFIGTVTNNTVAPAAVYTLTINLDKTVDNQSTESFIYLDPLGNTVNGNAVVNTTLGASSTYTFNVSSGVVNGVLSKAPAAIGASKTSGLSGNLYVGTVAPANLIGTLNGVTVNYTDGTFTSLQ